MFIADGTYRVERGETTDRAGDEIDAPEQIVATRVPGALNERNRQRSEGGVMMIVAVLTGRFRPGLDVQLGDRIINEQTGDKYTVDDLPFTPGISLMHGDRIVELKRVR